MSFRSASWEHRLLDWAYAGIESPASDACVDVGERQLLDAYETCARITHEHSRTFYMASGLLPPAKCRGVRALYAFCRTSDDIVDRAVVEGEISREDALEAWRQRVMGECDDPDDALVLAWTDTQATYGIPRLYGQQLIDGVDRDLRQTRYETFEELAGYCYGVASTVGLMAMHIVGFAAPEAVRFAVKLGVALQLTNILRDVGEDWRAGRLYLPQEELAAFHLDERDMEGGCVDERWRAFMRFQISRIRHLYAASLPGIRLLSPDGRFAIGAAAELYQAILSDIEAHDMDVFHRRAHTKALGKLRRLPGIWWRATVTGYREPAASGEDSDRVSHVQ
jgi:15-cis-phytoene synthase